MSGTRLVDFCVMTERLGITHLRTVSIEGTQVTPYTSFPLPSASQNYLFGHFKNVLFFYNTALF